MHFRNPFYCKRIIINDNIKIVVVEIRGDRIRLGIECPREIPIHRKEVYDAIIVDPEEKAEEKAKIEADRKLLEDAAKDKRGRLRRMVDAVIGKSF